MYVGTRVLRQPTLRARAISAAASEHDRRTRRKGTTVALGPRIGGGSASTRRIDASARGIHGPAASACDYVAHDLGGKFVVELLVVPVVVLAAGFWLSLHLHPYTQCEACRGQGKHRGGYSATRTGHATSARAPGASSGRAPRGWVWANLAKAQPVVLTFRANKRRPRAVGPTSSGQTTRSVVNAQSLPCSSDELVVCFRPKEPHTRLDSGVEFSSPTPSRPRHVSPTYHRPTTRRPDQSICPSGVGMTRWNGSATCVATTAPCRT
jgi:hypothetical protein